MDAPKTTENAPLTEKEVKAKIAQGMGNFKHGFYSKVISKLLKCDVCPMAWKVLKIPKFDPSSEKGYKLESKVVQMCPYYKKDAEQCEIPLAAVAEVNESVTEPIQELEAVINDTKTKLNIVRMKQEITNSDGVDLQEQQLLALLTKELELLHRMKYGEKHTIQADDWLMGGIKKEAKDD